MKRTAAYLLSFLMVVNPIVPALGAILPDNVIESDFESGHIYQPNESPEYQYQTPEYVEWSTPAAKSLESVYYELRDFDPEKTGGVKFIPIGMDGITTFIPVYKQYDFIGTQAAQNRYVRTQILALLRRNLIDSSVYQTESAQLNELYTNAVKYAKTTGYNFGDQLHLDQENNGLDFDMIWPELRRINNKDVIVPIVYLSHNTYSTRLVDSNEFDVGSYTAEGDVTVKNADIRLARDTFMGVAGNLRVEGSTVTGDGALKIVSQGRFDNVSSVIEANGDLTIGAASITNETIVYRYDVDGEQGTRYGAIAEINALNEGTLVLRSYSDIQFYGASASAEGDLILGADGNIYIGPQQIFEQHSSRFGNGTQTRTTVEYLQSHLSAKGTLDLMAGGEIIIDAANLSADSGHISLLAELGISVIDAEGVVHSEAKGSFGPKDVTETTYQTIAIRSVLDAGDGVIIHSPQGDITIRAADISSQSGTSVKATNGKVNLLMTVENDHYSYNSVKESLFTITNVSRGHTIDNPVPNTIVGGLAVEALYGVTVEYEGNPDFNLREQVNNLSENPELSWMADVMNASDLDVNWEEMELVYEEWNERNTSLSPAAVALITIIVAVYTGNPDAGTWLQAAMNAGSSAMMTQEVLAFTEIFLLNGGGIGDIDDYYKRIYSDEALTSAAVAMVTAGALHSLDAEFFRGMSDKFATTTVDGVESLSLLGQVTQATTHSMVRAGVRTLVAEGDLGDFGDALVQDLAIQGVNKLGRELAGKIGDAAKQHDINTAVQYISHAATGCLIGAATAQVSGSTEVESGCASGAGGAVIGEFVGSRYRDTEEFQSAEEAVNDYIKEKFDTVQKYIDAGYSDEQIYALLGSNATFASDYSALVELQNRGVDLSRLGAALGAFVAGADAGSVNIAADLGENAARYNAVAMRSITTIIANVDVIVRDVKSFFGVSIDVENGGVTLLPGGAIEFRSVIEGIKAGEPIYISGDLHRFLLAVSNEYSLLFSGNGNEYSALEISQKFSEFYHANPEAVGTLFNTSGDTPFASYLAVRSGDTSERVKLNARIALGGYVSESDLATIDSMIEAQLSLNESAVLDLSEYMTVAVVSTLMSNDNFASEFQSYLSERAAETSITEDFSANVSSISVGTLEHILRNFETAVDVDAPPHMRSEAQRMATLDLLFGMPYKSIVKVVERSYSAIAYNVNLLRLSGELRAVQVGTKAEAEIFQAWLTEWRMADRAGLRGSKGGNPAFIEETGGTLIYFENAGGHTVAKHIAKTDDQLLARFIDDPFIPGSGAFPDLVTAERAIADALAMKRDEIALWMVAEKGVFRLPIEVVLPYDVGRVIPNGQTYAHVTNGVKVILDRDYLSPKGYTIVTSYPVPRRF